MNTAAHRTIERELKQPLLKEEIEEPPGSRPATQPYRYISELERQGLSISNTDTTTGAATGFGNALGNVGILPSIWLFIITPWDQVGLSLSLGLSTGAIAIGLVSFSTLLLTIPMTYYAYQDAMLEAKTLVHDIEKAEIQRKKAREDLFFAYLHRCMRDEAEFDLYLKDAPNEAKEVNQDKLVSLVKSICRDNRLKSLDFNAKGMPAKSKETLSSAISDNQIMQDEDMRDHIFKQLSTHSPEFERTFDECFHPIEKIPHFYAKPILYGVNGAAMMLGTLFGTYWNFASIAVTAGVCASIPAIGWAIIALGCLAASIAIAVWIAKSKDINMRREVLLSDLNKSTQSIKTVTRHIEKTNLNKYLAEKHTKAEPATSPELTAQLRKAEAKALEEKALREQAQASLGLERMLRIKAENQVRELQQQLAGSSIAKTNTARMFKLPVANTPTAEQDTTLKLRAVHG